MLPLLEASFGDGRRHPQRPGGRLAAPPCQPASPRGLPRSTSRARRSRRSGLVDRRARDRPDFSPIQVMNTILGGSFASRLNMNLREKHGYTYGASSAFDMRAGRGPVRRGRRRADRQDIRGAAGVLQRAEWHPAVGARPKSSRAQRTTSRCDFLGASKPRPTSHAASKTPRLPPAGRLLCEVRREHRGGHAPRTCSECAEVHPAGSLAVVVVGDRKTIEPGIRR